jgi:hypothetical protein
MFRDLSEEEKILVKEQTKSLRHNLSLEYIKTFLLILAGTASIFVFYWLTMPQAQDVMDRERTKQVLEVLKENDPKIRAIGISLIKKTNPTLDKELQEFDEKIIKDANFEEYEILEEQIKKAKESISKTPGEDEKRILQNNIDMLEIRKQWLKNTIEKSKDK